jgi:hypothetical protein
LIQTNPTHSSEDDCHDNDVLKRGCTNDDCNDMVNGDHIFLHPWTKEHVVQQFQIKEKIILTLLKEEMGISYR